MFWSRMGNPIAIGLARLAGVTNIAKVCRYFAAHPLEAIRLGGVTWRLSGPVVNEPDFVFRWFDEYITRFVNLKKLDHVLFRKEALC